MTVFLMILAHFCLISTLYQSRFVAAIALPNSRRQSTGVTRKAGLGWGGGGNISQFEGHEVSWYFTWSPQSWVVPPPTELEFVPQLWGNKDVATFSSVVNTSSIAANGWKHILGMNEPQEPTQANMSPQDGASMWKTHLEPLRSAGVRLGAPATTSAPNGKTWLQEFLTACEGCTVDFVALHWYGNIAAEFIAYLEDFHNTFQRPIWVTEYSCQNFVNGAQCTYDEIVQFLNTTQTYMDQAPWVERYAWFGAMALLPNNVNNLTALMTPAGIINDLGRQYIGEPATQPTPTTTTATASSSSTFSTSASTSTTLILPTTSETSVSITSSSSPITNTYITSTSSRATTPTTSSTTLTATSASTTPPYVIINGTPMVHPKSFVCIVFSVALVGYSLL